MMSSESTEVTYPGGEGNEDGHKQDKLLLQ